MEQYSKLVQENNIKVIDSGMIKLNKSSFFQMEITYLVKALNNLRDI